MQYKIYSIKEHESANNISMQTKLKNLKVFKNVHLILDLNTFKFKTK